MKNVAEIIMAISAVVLTVAVVYLVNLERLKSLPQDNVPFVQEQPQYVLNTEQTANITGNSDELADVATAVNTNKLVEVTYKVHVDSSTNKYVYTYKLKYNGYKRIMLVWDTLDRIVNGDNNPTVNPYLIELHPDARTVEFRTESNYPPTLHSSFALCYKQHQHKPVWTAHALTVGPTPIPISAKN